MLTISATSGSNVPNIVVNNLLYTHTPTSWDRTYLLLWHLSVVGDMATQDLFIESQDLFIEYPVLSLITSI